MNQSVQSLEPRRVFSLFAQLCQIPHCSGKEKQISDFLAQFGRNLGLDVIQDQAWNVIIKKPGTPGRENDAPVILQGHMDMVCEKNQDVDHDFEKDPLQLEVEGEWLRAKGTTLGGDDGIAVAYALALLESDSIPHPPLEVLITTSEETGMDGAMNLDPKHLSAKRLINIDSEEEGIFLVGCAGGVRGTFCLPFSPRPAAPNSAALRVRIRGLKGGHSGMEIDKGRANANVLAARVLAQLLRQFPLQLASIHGGAKENAIPREADLVVLLGEEHADKLLSVLEEFGGVLQKEYGHVDPQLRVEWQWVTPPETAMEPTATQKLADVLRVFPNAVQGMSQQIPGMVESSLNLGIISCFPENVEFRFSIRSSVQSKKEEIQNRLRALARLCGASVTFTADYPAWEIQKESKLRQLFVDTWQRMHGERPKITAIHAGLECGLFSERLGSDVDMISMGPDMKDVHSPDEALKIPSVKRTWEFLLHVLENMH
ncbi:MAG TPA: aminoacyl-histidine dipeptidase [Thermotogota bacterium]|nr:aminoacyl-histidine dipeptidase [Thermotogota bacterium]